MKTFSNKKCKIKGCNSATLLDSDYCKRHKYSLSRLLSKFSHNTEKDENDRKAFNKDRSEDANDSENQNKFQDQLKDAALNGDVSNLKLLVGKVSNIPADIIKSLALYVDIESDENKVKKMYECAEILLNNGADPDGGCRLNLQDDEMDLEELDDLEDYSYTPLIDFVRNGRYEFAELLLKYGANPRAKMANMDVYRHARNRNNARMMTLIQEYLELTEGLLEAACNNDVETIKKLLKDGANINCTTDDGWTPLLEGVIHGVALTDFLLQNGADPNIASNFGFTPLMRAAEHGLNETVRLLLKYDADLKASDIKGWTAYDMAYNEKHFETCDILKKFQGE